MEKCRFITAIFAGTFFYVLISLFCGRDGLIAEKQLKEQKQVLSLSVEKIQKINDKLSLEQNALSKDEDVIKALAKKIGYVSSGDKIVIINGLSFPENFNYDPGTPLKAQHSDYLQEWIGKVIGIFAFFVIYIYLLYIDIRTGKVKNKKNSVFVEGIPVYDLPQM